MSRTKSSLWNIPFPALDQERGFSLIEVMIAMVVMAIGSCGLALLLMTSVNGTAHAQNQTNAALHAAELAQLIHANPASLGHFMFPEQEGDGYWAAGYFQSWQQELELQLNHAVGIVCRDATPADGVPDDPDCDGEGPAMVKIVWQEASEPFEIQRLALPLSQP